MRNCAIIHPLHLELETALLFVGRENDASKLACVPSFDRAPMLGYVLPLNEVTDNPSKLARYLFRDGG